ncbi:hypothetical protein MAR_015696 [Mya arenaria]|uniref:ATP-dependent DNA helicase n=1 Tax=Mya arenaria TaxID=6604 RepID=A0ABY7FJH7_MYAAR|nr:hypothetical protein MAR_015696 [Mya arenaria]
MDDMSLNRYMIGTTTSDTSGTRPPGVRDVNTMSKGDPSSICLLTSSVRTNVGLIEFTRMLCGPSSNANCFVIISSAAFVKQYGSCPGTDVDGRSASPALFTTPSSTSILSSKALVASQSSRSTFKGTTAVVLRHWRANMDIQMINDADGAAYYVCHYLCKSEPDELPCALGNLINTVFRDNPNMSTFQRLWNIGICSSRSIVMLNTRPKEIRFRMLKPITQLQDKDDDDTDIFMNNMIDYYTARPSNMEMVSLLYFASWYIKCPPSKNVVVKNDFTSKNTIYGLGRKLYSIVRFPMFSVSSDNYYFTLLMLLLPFRNECELIDDYSSAKEAFIAKNALLDHSMEMYNNFLAQVENSIRRIRFAQDELNDEPINSIPADIDFGIHAPSSNSHVTSCLMNETEFQTHLKTLTNCQQRALDIVRQHMGTQHNGPLRIFITGSGGVGKSFLLKMIVAYLQLYTCQRPGVDPVKCCSPTGTAARQINGHSLLGIPVVKYLNYGSLSPFQLRSLQLKLIGVHTIVIDEISMHDGLVKLPEIAFFLEDFIQFCLVIFSKFVQFVVHMFLQTELYNFGICFNLYSYGPMFDTVQILLMDSFLIELELLQLNIISHLTITMQVLRAQLISFLKMTEMLFSVCSRVMLLCNLNVFRGLVNGAMGTVLEIETNIDNSIRTILVIFDNIVGLVNNSGASDQCPVEIKEIEHKFLFGGRSIVRRAFPLSISWACTIH